MTDTFILFQIAGATYAVRSEQVQMVEMVEKITPVPNAPDFIEGVVSVRGSVIPVVNMRRRFHLEYAPVDLRTRIIVIRLDGRLIGMLVDSAREFARVEPEQVQPPPETLQGALVEYLDGVVTGENRLILMVNLEKMFSSDEREELVQPPSDERRETLAPSA